MTRQLLQPDSLALLRENHARQRHVRGTVEEIDFCPVAALLVQFSNMAWVLTELIEDDIAFGIGDLGIGFPEMGDIWLPELRDVNVQGLRVQQLRDFRTDKPISWWIREAQSRQSLSDVLLGDRAAYGWHPG